MKKLFKSLVVMAIAVLSATAPYLALGESFNPTNQLYNGQTCVSWPTNTVNATNFGVLTGGAISLANVESASFYMRGFSVGITNNTTTVKLVRAWTDTPPRVTFDTNGVCTRNDWETSPFLVLGANLGGSAGFQTWGTNLNPDLLGGANWIGVYSITNSITNGTVSVLTNFDVGMNKKIRKVSLQ